jgi:hypothetical protein
MKAKIDPALLSETWRLKSVTFDPSALRADLHEAQQVIQTLCGEVIALRGQVGTLRVEFNRTQAAARASEAVIRHLFPPEAPDG